MLMAKLGRILPETYQELQDEVYAYVRGKETAMKGNHMESSNKGNSSRVQTDSYGNNGDRSSRWRNENKNRSFRRQERGKKYAPYSKKEQGRGLWAGLIKSPREILLIEKVSSEIKTLQKLQGKAKDRDIRRDCEYHEDYGHDTDFFRELHAEVRKALKVGKLAHLINDTKDEDAKKSHGGSKKNEKWKKREDDPKPMEEEILMIRSPIIGVKRRSKVVELWEEEEISFPSIQAIIPSVELMIITAEVATKKVHRIFLDGGSASDIMYESCFRELPLGIQATRKEVTKPLIGFSGEVSWPLGVISLRMTLGSYPKVKTKIFDFMIIRLQSPYNIILGRPSMCLLGAVVSTVHGIMKFPMPNGMATIYSTRNIKKKFPNKSREEHEEKQVIHVCESPKKKEIINDLHPDQKITIGGQLLEDVKEALIKLLKENMDVFAWTPSDMTGVPRSITFTEPNVERKEFITENHLNVHPNKTLVQQKKRHLTPEWRKEACEQVRDLVEAGILREVQYQTWVANPVMVKKSDGGWRMCIDFTDINKACPKDCYPLLAIDWKVESLFGFHLKCFLDAYKGYHQIQMAKKDEDKTAFHTDVGIFCYQKMPFGLKNAGATYQRLVDKAFQGQIGRNIEAYLDDMVIKSYNEGDMMADIRETFKTIRYINMKLNPKKCTFEVEEGQFLGHLITAQRIKANPTKIQAIRDMEPPKTLKEVQCLNGRLAALSHFLYRTAERSLPFFKTLKNYTSKKDFFWPKEAESAFQEMKSLLGELPTLVAPVPGEKLFMYLSAAAEAISAVLLAERKKAQVPVYFISKALHGPEVNYPPMEKLVLALVHAARRLRRYFQAHQVVVITDQPLRQVLSKLEKSGRLAKWAIELGEHDVIFQPHISVKGQVLADFVAEITTNNIKVQAGTVQEGKNPCPEDNTWSLYTNGASSSERVGAGLILTNPEKKEFTYALRFEFPTSNNKAEYEALLAGLNLATRMGVEGIKYV